MSQAWLTLSERSTFAGSLRIVRTLGVASQGKVLYLAEQTGLGRFCALRLLDPKLVSTAAGKARFEELRGLRARIKSDHVVDVLLAGIDRSTGAPWFALSYVEGETLETHAREALDTPAALTALAQVAHGLAAIHDAERVHGRLDPERVIVAPGRYAGSPFTVTLLDFWTDAWLREASLAEDDDAASLYWRAPEQTAPRKPVGPAADVWAFGLLAFRLLTGKVYWESAARPGDSARDEVLAEVIGAKLAPASDRAASLGVADPLPDGFDDWFSRCVARAPDDRFARVDEALDELRPLLQIEAAADAAPKPAARRAPPSSLRRSLAPWAARMRSTDFAIPAGLGLALLLALGARTYLRARRPHVGVASATAAAAPTPAVAPAPAPSAPIDAGPPRPATLTETGAQDLATRLASAPHGSPAWITVAAADPAAEALAQRLVTIFQGAGWDVHPLQHSDVRARPGIFLFAADEHPPPYVETAERALSTAGLAPNVARGYRAFYDDMLRTNPNYRGFPFDQTQTFMIVVGRGQ